MSLKEIDTAFDTLWPTLVSEQAKYLAAKGKCFQGLRTHTAPPDKLTAPDRLAQKPAGKPDRWAQFCTLPAQMPYSLEIHEYVTPKNAKGWVAVIAAVVDGKTWTRCKGEGPEQRDTEWAEVKPLGGVVATDAISVEAK